MARIISGNDCAAPGCDYHRTGYSGKRSVFRFPTDKERLEKWLRNLRRKDFQPTKWSRLCEIHFDDHFIVKQSSALRADGTTVSFKLAKPRLSDNAVPTRFPLLYAVKHERVNSPSYFTSKSGTDRVICQKKAEFTEEKDETRKLSTLVQVLWYLDRKNVANSWSLLRRTEAVYLSKLQPTGGCVVLEKSITIFLDLSVKLFLYERGEPVESSLPEHLLKIDSFDSVDDLLVHCEIAICAQADDG